MSLKGMLGKEILPTGSFTQPKASVMGILALGVSVAVILAALMIGKWGFGRGKAIVGGIVPSVKGGADDLMASLEAL